MDRYWFHWQPLCLCGFTREAGENIRVISPRKASNEERKEFEEALQNGLETG